MIKKLLSTHPDSLRVFCVTEMWERYGFYVVQSLLALYMALQFNWPDSHVYALVGSFTAITYITPIIGGTIADHVLGQKRTILTGAVFLFFSYIFLGFVSSTASLIAALSGIAVGTGLLKPNIASLLGNEYEQNPSKKESGFTIFYMGITTGIILGTTLPSILNQYLGWSVSFLSASVGMVIAFFTFYTGMKRYRIADYQHFSLRSIHILIAAGMISLLWLFSFAILYYPSVANIAFGIVAVLSVLYIIYTAKYEVPAQAKQTLIIGLLCIISTFFWAFYFQMFLSLTLFISRVVNDHLYGFLFPPPYYVGIQSIGMLFFGYLISKKMSSTTYNKIHPGNKFLLAMLFMLLAYGIISFICSVSSETGKLPALHFIPIFLIISIAELLLSPVGLAAVTTLACRSKVSTMMGIFFVSLGLGGFLSGKLALITAIDPGVISLTDIKLQYTTGFHTIFFILLGATGVCFIINLIIRRLNKAMEKATY